MTKKSEVEKFLDYIGNCDVISMQYKWKYPKYIYTNTDNRSRFFLDKAKSNGKLDMIDKNFDNL